jgi:hypothetical protein
MPLAGSFHSMVSSIPPSVQGRCPTPPPPPTQRRQPLLGHLSLVSALHPCHHIFRVRPYTRSDRPDLLCIVLFLRPLFSLTHRLIAESRHNCGLSFSRSSLCPPPPSRGACIITTAGRNQANNIHSFPGGPRFSSTTLSSTTLTDCLLSGRLYWRQDTAATCSPFLIRPRAERLGDPRKGS